MKRTVLLIAACIALTAVGGAYAAAQITGRQIKNSTITGKDVKNRSLTPKDFRGSVRGPRGLTGAQGPQGAPGAQGPAGPSAVGQLTLVKSAQVPYGPSEVAKAAIAFCPAGQRAVSGGGINIGDEELAATQPTDDRSGWTVIGVDLIENGGEYVQATALCAPTNVAVAGSSRARARAHAELNRQAANVARAHGPKR
jgi:hypothetical protein